MMSPPRLTLSCVLLLACSEEPRTESIVEIDAEAGIKAAFVPSGSMHVRVAAGESLDELADSESDALDQTVEPARFPWRLRLAPRGGDAERVYAVSVTAKDAQGTSIAWARLVSGYVKNSTRYARILLEDACLGSECAELQTCRMGSCVDAVLDVEELSADAAQPTAVGKTPPTRDPAEPEQESMPDSSQPVPAPSSCADDTVCSSVFPCVSHPEYLPYVCRGQFPEWTNLSATGPYEIEAGVVTDVNTKLQWQQLGAPDGMPWRDALGYCEELSMAEHDDWRLPAKSELESLVKDSVQYPAIDSDAFPDTPDEAGYWSSTPSARDRDFAWMVSFTIGYSNADELKAPFRVRCVR